MSDGSWRTPLILLAASALLVGLGLAPTARATSEPALAPAAAARFTCSGDGLPDGPFCVHPNLFALDDQGEDIPLAEGAHRVRSGEWQTYEHLPRMPDRPADYEAYRYPVPPGLVGRSVVSGYDLDLPDDQQRRGVGLRHVGHGGLDLPQVRGAPVHVVNYEHQEGEADVLFVGDVFGHSVLLRSRIRQGSVDASGVARSGDLREYVTLFGHLRQAAPGLTAGMVVHEGDVIGEVGDSGSPGLVHLHLEIRRLRDNLDAATVLREKGASLLFTSASSVPTDPRNLLPLR